MFNKILVAVDGSEHSDKALRYATMFAENFNSKIILVHVFSIPNSVEPAIGSSLTPAIIDATHKSGEEILKRAEDKVEKVKKIKKRLIPFKKYLKQGNAVDQIIGIAVKEKVNLIIIGARGLSKLKEIFLGSVSEGVTHKAHCPVMIIK